MLNEEKINEATEEALWGHYEASNAGDYPGGKVDALEKAKQRLANIIDILKAAAQ